MILELTQQVASRELSERLRNLGFPQDTYFCWVEDENGKQVVIEWSYVIKESINLKPVAAPTSAEMGEFIPAEFSATDSKTAIKSIWYLEIKKRASYHPSYKTPFYISYWNHCVKPIRVHNFAAAFSRQTEADAYAAMLIYLIEQGLVKFKEAK